MQLHGIAASSGYAIGCAVICKDYSEAATNTKIAENRTEAEVKRFENALQQALEEVDALKTKVLQTVGEAQARIFETHLMLMEDEEFTGAVIEAIRTKLINAEAALMTVSEELVRTFEHMQSEYMRERSADIRDIAKRLLNILQGADHERLPQMEEPVVLFARDLTPSDTAQLSPGLVVGIASDLGGKTSHSAIMARSLDIPAVVGLQNATERLKTGDRVILDGVRGIIHIHPSSELLDRYRQLQARYEQSRKELRSFLELPSVTQDGRRVELAANIGNPQDAYAAKQSGAEGIGLFRTEFLYMGKTAFPDEEEQFQAYKAVAELFGKDRAVVIRTLDIGGDKELPYLELPQEGNPFLGYRAIRMCLDRPEMFRTQLRALLRASAYGNVKMMYPMISCIEELRKANQLLAEVRCELDKAGIAYNRQMEVGIMIEIPAAAMVADQLAEEADFFSIGTNDLVQYMMAADRMNERVAHLSEPFNPGVLRMIRNVIEAAHAKGRWVGMCGEMAGNLTAVPLLLGLGIDEFSMGAGAILSVRRLLSKLNYRQMEQLSAKALQLKTAAEIKHLIESEVPALAEWHDPL